MSNTNTLSTKTCHPQNHYALLTLPFIQPTFPDVSGAAEKSQGKQIGDCVQIPKDEPPYRRVKIIALTPAMGRTHGIDLRQLSDAQKDEL